MRSVEVQVGKEENNKEVEVSMLDAVDEKTEKFDNNSNDFISVKMT